MKKKLLDLGVAEDKVDEILKVVGENTVPRDKYNEVNEAKKQLEKDVEERAKQLDDLKASNKSNKELKSQIEALQNANEVAKTEYESKLASLRLDNGIELALTQSGALNNKAVKALLDLENIKFENEKLVGFDEQIEKLKVADSSAFLFAKKEEKPVFSGAQPAVGKSVEARPLTYSEMLAGK